MSNTYHFSTAFNLSKIFQHFNTGFPEMRINSLLPLIFSTLVDAKTFKVFHNTLDPAVFGTTGGAHHNATGEGNVDALSICIRFQVMFVSMPQSIDAQNTFLLHFIAVC